ncbi:inositol 1,4,5-trisphosphate receptor-interacting protein-like 1 isoform X1 [Corvus moneduloides]|uniref:inositol 1,4,5-trisphosphate receptor-interacting protein-like 1 isoform X1 n=1 Tax=Corvus moneduloides TaxID=1196302 RepID=UPI001363955B|nr:inositol 1,4,5-trisphosphate receptor-interacting protein-like 1 isoform X1 [Corvus moneduloides]
MILLAVIIALSFIQLWMPESVAGGKDRRRGNVPKVQQAMSPTLAFILALLATHTGLKVQVQVDEDAVRRMREREEYLHQEMTQLLQEIEGSSGTMETLLPSALQQQWLFWIIAAALVLVLLAVGCWLVRRRKRGSASCSEQERSNSLEKVGSQEKQDPPSLEVLKELLEDLLSVCRVLSRRNFMPELHPATGMDTSSEAWSIPENSTVYRPLVILRPPPGHSFSVGSTKQPPAGRVRVALECLCSGEQLLGQRCFLHASGGQLQRDQRWYLLDTLCTGSYLDVEKVSCWVQTLVPSAWLLLPHSLHCQLTALPCGKSCSFQLTSTSGLQISLEMALAVQQGSSGAYLSLE